MLGLKRPSIDKYLNEFAKEEFEVSLPCPVAVLVFYFPKASLNGRQCMCRRSHDTSVGSAWWGEVET